MYEVMFLFLLGLVWIVFASVEDIRTREVANWICFSLAVFALGFRFFFGLFEGNFSLFYQGLIGLVIFIILGNLLYYSRMFAGGDAKLMMALGAVLGVSTSFIENLKTYFLFLFLFLLTGAVYGLVMTFIVSFRNFKKFKKGFSKVFKEKKKIFFLFMFLGIAFVLFGFFEKMFFTLGVVIFAFSYLYIYAKAVDDFCMIKKIKVGELTEGDWLYKAVKVGNKKIEPIWDGVNKKEINLIKKYHKEIWIKYGIVFIPVFLIAYLIFFYFLSSGLWNAFW